MWSKISIYPCANGRTQAFNVDIIFFCISSGDLEIYFSCFGNNIPDVIEFKMGRRLCVVMIY